MLEQRGLTDLPEIYRSEGRYYTDGLLPEISIK